MKFTKEDYQKLEELKCSVRFRHNGPQFTFDKTTREPVRTADGYCECVVVDDPTGEEYVWERGDTEPDAFAKAMLKAPAAPKPLTESQKATAKLVKAETDKALEAANSKIAELEARLKAAEAPFDGGVPSGAKAPTKTK